MTTLRALLAMGRVPPGRLALAVVLGTLSVGFGAALMGTSGYLISRAAEQPPILSLGVAIVAVRFFGLARPLSRYLDRLASHDLALGALGRIRARFYERIEPLAPGQIESYRSGDLLSRMVGDVDALQDVYVRGLVPAAVAVASGGLCAVAAAVLLPAAGAILAVGLLVGGVAVPGLGAVMARSAGRRQAEARAAILAELVEVLRGSSELVAFGREADVLARVRGLDRELSRLARRHALAAGLTDALAILVAGLTTTAVLATAVAARADGTLERTLVAALALVALASFDAVAPLADGATAMSGVLASGRRVLDLVEREPVVRDPAEPLAVPAGVPAVAVERVTATYGSAQPAALLGCDLDLRPGSKLAVLGPSGAGKTTLTRLLLRFLDPADGRVCLACHDVRRYRQEDVRSRFGLAGQDAYLFDSTIAANLRIGRPDASDAELADALRRARLLEFVAALPAGVHTRIGVQGRELSGGQRQRLTVARALLSDAPVLVLDEPFAHLDHDTAEELARDILAASGGRSVLLLTHRDEGLDLVDGAVALGAPRGQRAGGSSRRNEAAAAHPRLSSAG